MLFRLDAFGQISDSAADRQFPVDMDSAALPEVLSVLKSKGIKGEPLPDSHDTVGSINIVRFGQDRLAFHINERDAGSIKYNPAWEELAKHVLTLTSGKKRLTMSILAKYPTAGKELAWWIERADEIDAASRTLGLKDALCAALAKVSRIPHNSNIDLPGPEVAPV